MANRRRQFILVTILITLLLFEAALRTAYGLGWISVLPRDLIGWDLMVDMKDGRGERLFMADRHMISAMRPNVRISYQRFVTPPNVPDYYEVRTNSLGFRTPEFQMNKPAGSFRIVCLGDSSTFGMNVETDDAYPGLLGRLLNEAHPNRFEVLNLGVPGYSSRQGLQLVRRLVRHLDPDMVIFAYGTNDRFWKRPTTDNDKIQRNERLIGALVWHLRAALGHIYTYRVVKRGIMQAIRFVKDPEIKRGGRSRVSIDGIANAMAESQRLLTEGTGFLILNNDFYVTNAVVGITKGARVTGADYIDMVNLFNKVRQKSTKRVETSLGLPAPNPAANTLLVRVLAPAGNREIVLEYRFRTLWKIGRNKRISMRDDGKEGDQRAGDGLWSARVPLGKGKLIRYFFWERRENGLVREYRENYPAVVTGRMQMIPDSGIGEIDQFADLQLYSDNVHPNEFGHRVIAEALFQRVLANERTRTHLTTQ